MSPHRDVAGWIESRSDRWLPFAAVCWPSSLAIYPADRVELAVPLVQAALAAHEEALV